MPSHGPRQDKTHEPTVLVVDDDPWMRCAMRTILTEAGYLVKLASNGFTGLRLARELRPHVILLDLELPELSGTAVVDELRQHPATCDLVVILKRRTSDVPGLVSEVHAAIARCCRSTQRAYPPQVRRRRLVAPAAAV